jgi:hypothetical protein
MLDHDIGSTAGSIHGTLAVSSAAGTFAWGVEVMLVGMLQQENAGFMSTVTWAASPPRPISC